MYLHARPHKHYLDRANSSTKVKMFRRFRREEYLSPDAHLRELIENLKDDIPDFLESRAFTQYEISLIYDMHSVIHNQERRWVESGGGVYNGGGLNGGRFAQSVTPSRGGTISKLKWIMIFLLLLGIWLIVVICGMIFIVMNGLAKFDAVPGAVKWYSACMGTDCHGRTTWWPFPLYETWGETPPRSA
ncbi:fb99bfa5-80db-4b17-9597-fa5ff8342044-CDS [Sclerotinia trifoliorum]|uniref:Fb99bfa5-80db-4b17-9597-fa5ff8342044-CDS n=1 Tax=Sclerotinia trifoliorum TaxID=28548 RepID=A0A8H2VML0_9HELO|nr:fb99bfa5-80db-4b17-9597-fa5ff8342044-CDS [Sclerotinia trifoliorum]